jgi:hypothetical protein
VIYFSDEELNELFPLGYKIDNQVITILGDDYIVIEATNDGLNCVKMEE